MKQVILAFGVLLLAACATAQGPDSAPVGKAYPELETQVQAAIDSGLISGAVALVREGDSITFSKAWGARSFDGPTMTQDSIFRLYSMTKPVVSVAAMMLVEEGKLDLDAPVSQYIPAYADVKVYVPGDGDGSEGTLAPLEREITVRDALSHQTGYASAAFAPDPLRGFYFQAEAYRGAPHKLPEDFMKAIVNPAPTIAVLVERLANVPAAHQPGAAWTYGDSTNIVGRLVEVVSGMELDDFLQARIFGPLGMVDSGYIISDDKRERFVTQYQMLEDQSVIEVSGPDHAYYGAERTFFPGASGLISTAGDYDRFVHMLLNRGELDGVRILKAETIDLMAENQLSDEIGYLEWLPGHGFGLGFSVTMEQLNPEVLPSAVGELAWAGWGGTHFLVDRAGDIGAVLLTQTNVQNLDSMWSVLRRGVYGVPAPAPQAEPTVEVP